jgi:anti-anti-sigma regulatory factor
MLGRGFLTDRQFTRCRLMRSQPNLSASPEGSQESRLPELGVCGQALIEFDLQPQRLVISVYGTLDLPSSLALDDRHLSRIAVRQTHTVVDVAGLAFTEPAALQVLLRRQRLATRIGSRVHLRIAPHQVPHLLKAEEAAAS